jgi:PAS domain S-box-containing protein
MGQGQGRTEQDERRVCPVTGLPVLRRPEWTEVRLDERYSVTVETIGDHIVHSMPRGYASLDGVKRVLALHDRVLAEAIEPGSGHVHIADYRHLEGASLSARRDFARHIENRPGIVAFLVYNPSPLFTLSIKLAQRFRAIPMGVEVLPDYATALRRAVDLLRGEGIEEEPASAPDPAAEGATRPESGVVELDTCRLEYEILDGHIVHGGAIGTLGLREMTRELEVESLILSSVDPADGPLVFVADMTRLDGITAAARRLYVATLRQRHRSRPIALFVCYGVGWSLRRAINISRPYLPFRIRVVRDRATALEAARREARSAGTDTMAALEPRPATKPVRGIDVDEVLRLIANIDWSRQGPVTADREFSPDEALQPVVDAFSLIKAEVDNLFDARRKTENELRQSEARYRAILDSIVDGYYEIDFDGNLLFSNDALLRIFGFSRDDVDRINPMSLMDEANLERAIGIFRRVFDTRQPEHPTNLIMLRKDGTPINVEASISPVVDSDGDIVGFHGIVRDISDRIRTAQEKADLEARLQRSQRMEAIGTLAGGIAHNFNNLLMGIQGNVSLLLRELADDHPHTKRLATVEALVDGGSKLTAQLLGYARSGRVDVRTVDLNRLARDTTETFGLTRREYRIHFELIEREIPIEVDASQIEQVLLNLLINAAEAMPHGGDIRIASTIADRSEIADAPNDIGSGSFAVLRISDTGCGIEDDALDHLFEPFFTTKGMSGGTGLGLASAYGIVRAHGGLITVDSTLGEGSAFSIVLPVSGRNLDPIEGPQEEPVTGEGVILVVDDDEAVLDACASMLSLLNYTPIRAGSGASAIEVFDRRHSEIDLVVLDLILADMAGGEVFDRLRAIDPSVQVLLASGYSLDGEAAGILERGCDDFIQKPFSVEQLSHKLEALLRKP